MSVEVLRAKALEGVRHGFLGRRGGVSTGVCAGLNVGLGSHDDREALNENRRRAIDAVAPGARLVTLHQVHSGDALAVTEPFPQDRRPRADGMATDRPDLLLGILTADCAPVLFADPEAGVIGAAHAGWKGALTGVLDATLRAMERLGAERARVVAAVGPAISGASYEVGPEFRARFLDADPGNEAFFRDGERLRFDLPAYVAVRLMGLGIREVEDVALCTYRDEARFFSFRRATHRAEPDYGRLFSAIVLTG